MAYLHEVKQNFKQLSVRSYRVGFTTMFYKYMIWITDDSTKHMYFFGSALIPWEPSGTGSMSAGGLAGSSAVFEALVFGMAGGAAAAGRFCLWAS